MGVLWAALFPLVAAVNAEAAKPACPGGDEIAYTAAPHCVGESRHVAGRIDHVSRNRSGLTFVNFCVDWKSCPFTGVVYPDKAELFATLPRLSGSEVVVSGRITQYQGRAQIILSDPSQITVRSAPPRPSTPLVVAPPPPPVAVNEAPVHRPHHAIAPIREPEEPTAGSGSDASPVLDRPLGAPPPVEPARPLTASLPPPKEEPLHAVVIAPAKPVELPKPPADEEKTIAREPEAPAEAPHGTVTDAARFIGQKARLKGQVKRLDFNGGELVVYFRKGSGEATFVAVVPEADVERLQHSAEAWDGKTVELEGDVRLYDGRPGMFVNEAAQVRVLQPHAAR